MATSPAPVAPKMGGKGFITRELNGATFLTLEHIAHMALVVVVTCLVLSGVLAAMSMWFGTSGMASLMGSTGMMLGGAGAKAMEGALSLGVVAALLVLVPALVILDRRTRAEWHKRAGFAGRLAYKVPVYSALAVLAIIEVAFFIQMLYVVITSLALIGVKGAPIGSMYVEMFIPALIGYALFSAACWYVFLLAKGRDNGKLFSMIMGGLGIVVAVALFITTVVVLHENNDGFNTTPSTTPSLNMPRTDRTYDEDYYRDLLDKYYQ